MHPRGEGGSLPIHTPTQPSSPHGALMRLLRWWWRPGEGQQGFTFCEAWVLVHRPGGKSRGPAPGLGLQDGTND